MKYAALPMKYGTRYLDREATKTGMGQQATPQEARAVEPEVKSSEREEYRGGRKSGHGSAVAGSVPDLETARREPSGRAGGGSRGAPRGRRL